MLTKESLKKHFAANYKDYYSVPLFEREGFERRKCTHCGKGFWTAGNEWQCGDSSHTEYSFFRKEPRKETYATFWKKCADFWKANGHEVIDRYPTLCRWRDDLPFTIASIVDFQRLEGGKVVFEYPANPLFVPQMCLRFPDIANVGVTGRHFTCFMMAGQHAFNPPQEGYWKEECLEYNYKFLREVLEIPKEEITYGEDVWNMPDFSAFGPSIESFSRGSELVNSVFMHYRASPGQASQTNTNAFSELEMKVIDVGWGFERLLWYYNGTPSAYDAVFPREVEYMKRAASLEVPEGLFNWYAKLSATLDIETVHDYAAEKKKIANSLGIDVQKLEKTIAPLQAIYAIADHSRSLLFALSDGALPSNSAGGYNLRVLARRAFSFIEKYQFPFSVPELARMHAEDLHSVFPELSENLDVVERILEVEKRKYGESVVKAKRLVVETLKKSSELSTKQMVTLYESNGVTPEMIEQVSAELGKQVSVPTNFYSELTKERVMAKSQSVEDSQQSQTVQAEVQATGSAGGQVEKIIDVAGVQPTKLLYYQDVDLVVASAKLLAVKGNALVFDQTIFYPEGGGQMYDKGTIEVGELIFNVVEVQKQGGVVLHFIDKSQSGLASGLKLGSNAGQAGPVVMRIDLQRRLAIMRHHTATHMLVATAYNVLGPHVWQHGSKKDQDMAHLDITHFEKPTMEQIHEIERRINMAIRASIPVEVLNMPRKEAEQQYGMRLYQGGGAVSKIIRVIKIPEVDTEACGGTHVHNTSDLGFFKIRNVEQVQDGVVRFYYSASLAALDYVQEQENLLDRTASVLSVPRKDVPKTSERFFNEWKKQRNELDQLQLALAESIAREQIAAHKADKKVEIKGIALPAPLVEKIADRIAREEGFTVVVSNKEGFVVSGCNPTSGQNALELLKSIGAKGGGNEKFARGKLVV